tara:strand:+ start:3203 stop:3736 length:534 start_codon:yes stop_codon:yes gene_type:complete
MAYLEYNYLLSDEQDLGSVSGSNTNTASTNAVNLQTIRDLAQGHPLFLHFNVTEAFDGGTDLRLLPVIVGPGDVSGGVANLLGTSQRVVGSTPVMLVADDLNLNADIVIPIGGLTKGVSAGNQAANSALYGHTLPHGCYFGVVYNSNGTFTAGKITARLSLQSGGVVPDIYPASTSS